MDTSRFLITGANGQLGTALRAHYPDAQTVDSTQLDISSPEAISGYDWSKVDVILNAAAYTNVDGAETAEGRVTAWRVNAGGPANLARIATDHDITLIHISSEYVFDGTVTPHKETEPFSPLGVYAAIIYFAHKLGDRGR
jgi:dTDP-4-dehydrorhamnose reductase